MSEQHFAVDIFSSFYSLCCYSFSYFYPNLCLCPDPLSLQFLKLLINFFALSADLSLTLSVSLVFLVESALRLDWGLVNLTLGAAGASKPQEWLQTRWGITCGGPEWWVDIHFVFSTCVITLSLYKSESDGLVQVWGCLYVPRLGLEWEW